MIIKIIISSNSELKIQKEVSIDLTSFNAYLYITSKYIEYLSNALLEDGGKVRLESIQVPAGNEGNEYFEDFRKVEQYKFACPMIDSLLDGEYYDPKESGIRELVDFVSYLYTFEDAYKYYIIHKGSIKDSLDFSKKYVVSVPKSDTGTIKNYLTRVSDNELFLLDGGDHFYFFNF